MVNAPPAMAELSTSLITDGTAGRIAEWKRKEIVERQTIARRVLAGLDVRTQPNSPHLWVLLPESWRTEAFVARARHRGILLNSAESFVVGHETDVEAVRISLGPPSTRSALEDGLTEIVRLLKRVPEAYELVV